MTPAQVRAARLSFNLSLFNMGQMLGFKGKSAAQAMHQIEIPAGENGHRPISKPRELLMEIYLSGYRPADWPKERPARFINEHEAPV